MSFYLLEIGCEEIPAAFVPQSAEYLKNEFEKQLTTSGLPVDEIVTGGTPRRLYVYLKNLADKQINKSEIIVGPPAKIAFDGDELTVVGKKFVESKGLDITTVKKVATPKGDYLQGEKKTGGSDAKTILSTMVPTIINNMPFPKSMKWGAGDFKFARPIHWFLSLLSGNVLDFEVGGIKSDNFTFGHRFMAPEKITVTDFDQYKNALEKAYVIIDSADRKEMIKVNAANLEKENGFKISLDEGLLNTVADLVEYPHGVVGSFDESFLMLPKEVLITSMKVHQKYFPVEDNNGKLVNKFVGISNMLPPTGDDLIRQGYERVLKARLNDAVFFFTNDKAVPLLSRVEALKKVVYQEKLGTSYEKMTRFKNLAVYLAKKLSQDKVESVEQTAELSKADLMSEMVYEFPELQGVMGSYYAKLEGKSQEISKGIFEHYLPRFAGDRLPETWEGRLTSIADKLDTIAGAFAAGMIPTGNVDPYGLRRNAIGILSIIENADIRIDIKEPVDFALKNLESKLKFNILEVSEKVVNFIMQRWKQMLSSRGNTDNDVFDAVSSKSSDPIALKNLAQVLTGARASDNFQIIAGSFKRINNILKKNVWDKTDYNVALFQADEEKEVARLIEEQNIEALIRDEKNYDALDELMKFAPAVDAFFDKVMVMAEDEAVRANRLSLILKLRSVFLAVGDFDVIALKDK